MEKKQVVFVSNFLGNGGAARVICVLAEELAAKGHLVTICSFAYDKAEEYKKIESVSYVNIPTIHKSGLRNKIERIRKLRNELKKHPDATIISFEYFMNMQTIVAMFGLKNRLIISERNDPVRVGGKTPTKQLRNLLYSFADCLVCQTQDALEYFPKAIQKKSVVILNPIKDNLPEPWQGERKKQIVNFCRLEKQKNLPLLIDSFEEFYKIHPDYTLIIYGDGKQRESLTEYIVSKGLECVVTLHPAVQDIHDRIKDAMMFVSSSDYEGLSNSMLEAMAIGLPTICTDCPCGGARMVIEDGVNGFLIPAKNQEELVSKISYLADHQDYLERISKEGCKLRASLKSTRIAEEWKKVIEG